jgi:hypothetical protein
VSFESFVLDELFKLKHFMVSVLSDGLNERFVPNLFPSINRRDFLKRSKMF